MTVNHVAISNQTFIHDISKNHLFNLLKMWIYSPTEKAPASRVRAPAPPPSRGRNRGWGLHDWRWPTDHF